MLSSRGRRQKDIQKDAVHYVKSLVISYIVHHEKTNVNVENGVTVTDKITFMFCNPMYRPQIRLHRLIALVEGGGNSCNYS